MHSCQGCVNTGKPYIPFFPRVILHSSLARRVSRNIAIPAVHATRNTPPQHSSTSSTGYRMPFDLLVPTPYSPPRHSLSSAHASDISDQTPSHSIRLSQHSMDDDPLEHTIDATDIHSTDNMRRYAIDFIMLFAQAKYQVSCASDYFAPVCQNSRISESVCTSTSRILFQRQAGPPSETH